MYNFHLIYSASRVQLDLETNRDLGSESTRELLDKLYRDKYNDAIDVINNDIQDRGKIQTVCQLYIVQEI